MKDLLKALEITDSLLAQIDVSTRTYKDVNISHEKVLGYKREDLIGKNVFELIHPLDRTKLETLLDDSLEQSTKEDILQENIEYRILDKENKWRSFRANVALTMNEIYVSAQDITEHEENKTIIESERRRIKTIIETIEEGIYEADLKGDILFANEGFSKMIGIPLSSLIGMNYKEFCDERYIDEIYHTFHTVFKTGEIREGYGWKLYRNDGNELEINSSIQPIYDKKGNICSFMGVAKDLTEHNKKKRFQTAMETIGGILHEVNQDLQIIMGYNGMLLYDEDRTQKDYQALKNSEMAIKRLKLKMDKLQGIKKYEVKPYIRTNVIDIDCLSEDNEFDDDIIIPNI